MKEHIVSTYDDDLNTLKTKLLEMGVLVERQIFQAIEITKIINLAKAKKIQKADDAIDSLEVEIREFATKTLTKRQPLADDLRKIIISLKISSILESELVITHLMLLDVFFMLKKVPDNYVTESIYQLGQLVVKNYSKALSSFDQDSQKIAQIVPTEDVTINSVYETCFREHLHIMMEDREIIGFSTQMLFIAKELERIGDLSKVISKEVIYNLKGENSLMANNKKQIVVVEDDTALLPMITYNLEKNGFSVREATNGEDALMLIKEQLPALAIIDWMIPAPTGIEVCKIKEEGKETISLPIIILSAKGEEEDKVRGLNTGADDYVTKPFSPVELIARVNSLLEDQLPLVKKL